MKTARVPIIVAKGKKPAFSVGIGVGGFGSGVRIGTGLKDSGA